jgi:L-amino acid N-acyltransferase YncA
MEDPEELEMMLSEAEPWASLGSVGVDLDKRGTGLGKQLVAQFIDAARAHGANSIILLATVDGEQVEGFDLQTWYERLGFNVVTTTEQGLPVMERSVEPLNKMAAMTHEKNCNRVRFEDLESYNGSCPACKVISDSYKENLAAALDIMEREKVADRKPTRDETEIAMRELYPELAEKMDRQRSGISEEQHLRDQFNHWQREFLDREYPDLAMTASGEGYNEVLYHVTKTTNVAKIKKNGLQRFKPSNWAVAESGARYGEGEVYAMTEEFDALRWAGRMDWELNKKTGSGKISIVRFKPGEEEWEVDYNDPMSQGGNRGQWIKTMSPIPASQIIDAYPVGPDQIKRFIELRDAEWNKTSTLHTQEDAQALIGDLQSKGISTKLVGGVEQRGESFHDIDLLTTQAVARDSIIQAFTELGWTHFGQSNVSPEEAAEPQDGKTYHQGWSEILHFRKGVVPNEQKVDFWIPSPMKSAAQISDVFHGTTQGFEAFSLEHASESSWYGKAFFFTSDYTEAKQYANPDNDDLAGRLEILRDKILNEWYDKDDLAMMKYDHDGEEGEVSEEYKEALADAFAEAKKEIVGNEPSIKRVRIELNKPVKVSRGGTTFTADETFKQALESVATKHQVKWVEQIYDVLINSVIQKTTFSALEFEEGAKRLEVWGLNISKPGQFVADVYRALGFDGIIMTPSSVFRRRGLKFNPGTKHYMVWDTSQIKLEGTDPVKTAAANYTGPYAFYIEVPKSARDHFWSPVPEGQWEFWAFRTRPRVLKGEKIIFTFDKKPVAETVCDHVEKPGESKCELTGKYERHWKIVWLPSDFKKYKEKTASPDFGYSKFNDREADLAKLKWSVLATDFTIDINARDPEANPHATPPGFLEASAYDSTGRLSSDDADKWDSVRVKKAIIRDEWKGTGLGQMLYDRLIVESRKQKRRYLISDLDWRMSPDAYKAWEKLSKRYPMVSPYKLDLRKKTASGPVAVSPDGRYKDFQLTIEHGKSYIGTPMVTVRALKDGTPLGYVTFAKREDKKLDPMSLDITATYHRQGLATAMYVYAERQTGYTVIPSTEQTPAGKSLWAQPDRPFGKEAAAKPFPDSKVPQMVYHGTREPFTRVNMSHGAQGLFWVASDKASIEKGEAGANSSKCILGCYINVQNPAGWAEYENKSIGELKRDGFDSVVLPDPDGTFDVILFKPNQVRIVGEMKTAAAYPSMYHGTGYAIKEFESKWNDHGLIFFTPNKSLAESFALDNPVPHVYECTVDCDNVFNPRDPKHQQILLDSMGDKLDSVTGYFKSREQVIDDLEDAGYDYIEPLVRYIRKAGFDGVWMVETRGEFDTLAVFSPDKITVDGVEHPEPILTQEFIDYFNDRGYTRVDVTNDQNLMAKLRQEFDATQ